MKTIIKALSDEIYYPIPKGTLENRLIKRGLDGDADFTKEVMESNEFKGALADSLYSLIQAVNYSEADKSVNQLTDKQREQLLLYINKLYKEIGEEEVLLEPEPVCYFDF